MLYIVPSTLDYNLLQYTLLHYSAKQLFYFFCYRRCRHKEWIAFLKKKLTVKSFLVIIKNSVKLILTVALYVVIHDTLQLTEAEIIYITLNLPVVAIQYIKLHDIYHYMYL